MPMAMKELAPPPPTPGATAPPVAILGLREVRRALVELPGWRSIKYGRRLLGEFRLQRDEDAAAFVIAALVTAIEVGLAPEVEILSPVVRVVVSEVRPWAVSPRVLTFAGSLSTLAGSPGSPAGGPPRAALSHLTEDLIAWRGRQTGLRSARGAAADPVAGMVKAFATFEATVRALVPWLDEAREALAPLLPDEAEIERRAASDTLTRPMQLDRDARLLGERLDPLLALLRAAQASDPRAKRSLDPTEDLTPHLQPKPRQGPSEP